MDGEMYWQVKLFCGIFSKEMRRYVASSYRHDDLIDGVLLGHAKRRSTVPVISKINPTDAVQHTGSLAVIEAILGDIEFNNQTDEAAAESDDDDDEAAAAEAGEAGHEVDEVAGDDVDKIAGELVAGRTYSAEEAAADAAEADDAAAEGAVEAAANDKERDADIRSFLGRDCETVLHPAKLENKLRRAYLSLRQSADMASRYYSWPSWHEYIVECPQLPNLYEYLKLSEMSWRA